MLKSIRSRNKNFKGILKHDTNMDKGLVEEGNVYFKKSKYIFFQDVYQQRI